MPGWRRVPRLLALLSLGLLGMGAGSGQLGAPDAVANSTLQHFEGGAQDELSTYLAATPKVVYSRRIDALKAGEIDKVLAEASFTNMEDNYGGFAGSCVFTVAVDTQLLLTSSPVATTGVAISTPSRTSITADMHHSHVVEAGTYSAAQASSGLHFVNLVASSQISDSTCGSPAPHTRVDQGLGRISILRFRPTTLAGASASFDLQTARQRTALLSSLQIPGGGQAEAVVYSLRLDGLRTGEALEVWSDSQVSRTQARDLDVSARLVLAKSAGEATGTTISPSNGFRMAGPKYAVGGMSRRPLIKDGAYRVPATLAGKTRYVNLVVSAADQQGIGFNELEITPGWGGIDVLRHLPSTKTGTPPAAPTSPPVVAPEVRQAEDMSIPVGSEVIADSRATPSASPMSVKMTDAGTLSRTITTARPETVLTLYTGGDICAVAPGYPNGSTFEGGPVARVTVDGTVVAETQTRYDHATTGFRPQQIPVVMPAGPHAIEVAFTNPAARASPACVRRLYVDRLELSAPPPPPERLSALALLGGGSFAEQTSGLPLALLADGSVQWRVVYSQPLTNLKKGEVIQAMAEVELRNPYPYTAVAAGRFILADRPDQTISELNSPVIALDGAISENIPPGAVVAPSRVASYATKTPYTQTKYLNFVMYAAANNAVGAGDAVVVGADTGRLHVLRYAPLDK